MSPAKRNRSRRTQQKPAAFNLKRLREDVDTYTEGIYAVLAFLNKAMWNEQRRRIDDAIPHGMGRRFVTSASNRIASAETEVTPDCAVQLSAGLGIIAEAKPGVSRLAAVWEENIRQLQKYDDDLTGWWTGNERVAVHDIVALVPMTRAVDFKDMLEARLRSGDAKFNRKLAIVAFYKQTGAENTYVVLKTEFGSVSDRTLADRLRRAQAINWSVLLTSGRDKKFLDVEPPLPYTLHVLWDYLFAAQAHGQQPEPKEHWITIKVDVASLTSDVQRFYGFSSSGARCVEIPRQKWIRKAMDALVVIGLAQRTKDGTYLVKYGRRRRTKDTLQYFGELCHKNRDRISATLAAKPLIEMAEMDPTGSIEKQESLPPPAGH